MPFRKKTNEGNVFSETLIKLILNSLYGEKIENEIDYKQDFKIGNKMLIEYDETVVSCHKILNGIVLQNLKMMKYFMKKIMKSQELIEGHPL